MGLILKARRGGLIVNCAGRFSFIRFERLGMFELYVIMRGVLLRGDFFLYLSICDLFWFKTELYFVLISWPGYNHLRRLSDRIDLCASSELMFEQFLCVLGSVILYILKDSWWMVRFGVKILKCVGGLVVSLCCKSTPRGKGYIKIQVLY